MLNNNMEILREQSIEALKDFPKVLEPHMDFVQTLGERFKTRKTWTAKAFVHNWKKYNEFEKYYFLGWMRAAIKRNGVTATMRYLSLRQKQDLDFELSIILDGATEEELKFFRLGEDAVNNYK